jgi:peptide/nickel transport system ATP-binding protein
VVPEATDLTPQILTGEIPDPRRIPTGCRFHPRCPLLKSGTVEHIATRCRGEDPDIIPADALRAAACHAVPVSITSG